MATNEREAGFSQDDWLARIARGANFLAYADDPSTALAGIVGAFEPRPGTAELVSMWVRPEVRGRGVARALVKAVVQWARGEGHAHVHLRVTETNDPARRLYERCGFALTGARKPLPSRQSTPRSPWHAPYRPASEPTRNAARCVCAGL